MKYGERTQSFDDAYQRAKELPENEPISWEMLSEHVFQIPIPSKSNRAQWVLYRDTRQKYKDAINERCKNYGDNWRLYMRTNGVDLVKQESRMMVDQETTRRVKRAAEAFALFAKRLQPMLTADGLNQKDKKMLRQMSVIGQGSAMAMAGQINSMTAFNKEEKKQLTSMLLSFSDGDDGDAS